MGDWFGISSGKFYLCSTYSYISITFIIDVKTSDGRCIEMTTDLRIKLNKLEYDLTQIENAYWILENDIQKQGLKIALELLKEIEINTHTST